MDTKKMSYGLGVLVGKNLASQVISSDMSLEDLNKGINDALKGAELDMPLEEANRLAQTYLQGVAERAAGKAKEDGFKIIYMTQDVDAKAMNALYQHKRQVYILHILVFYIHN